MKVFLCAIAALLSAIMVVQPACAEWHEASSEHFVIYADDSEKDIQQFSENLERFHSSLQYVFPFGDKPPPSPSNRVTIYVTDGEDALQKLAGENSRNVAGFYIPRAGASVAFTQPVGRSNAKFADFSQVVLLHEYGHHYMISNLPHALPRWYTEGFAEYVGTTTFSKDGTVGFGKPAVHRGAELFNSKRVPWRLLFDSRGYDAFQRKHGRYDAFYGQSWAVFHYLQHEEEGRAKNKKFLAALNAGITDIEAAEAAFGNLKEFGTTIDRYIRQRRMTFIPISPEKLSFKPVKITKLSAGEAAVMPVIMQSRRGVNEVQAAAVVEKAREIAIQYPDDPAVQAALAEAEYDAGNDDAAVSAADKATSAERGNIKALLQKGYALFRKAESSNNSAKAYEAVRKHFVSINKFEADHPIPLIYFYRSFVAQGADTTENAKTALDWALQLSPFDKSLRLQVAVQDMQDGRHANARSHLLKLIYDPHRQTAENDPLDAMLKLVEKELGIAERDFDQEEDAETTDTDSPESTDP